MKIHSTYMGLKLDSPILVSACTLSEQTDNIVKMEDNGAGAVVMFSLFEEQIRKEEARFKGVMSETTHAFPEALDYFPDLDDFNVGTDDYLENIRKAKERVKIPIIGSLNGITNEGWIDYSKMMEQAGADGIEVNIFFIPGDVAMSSSQVEHRYLNIIESIKQSVKIPVAVKLNPYFSAMGNMSLRMQNAGADALVLFNRFYQPDFDINELIIKTDLHYSESSEIRLPLLWIALLYGKVKLSLAATTGVQSAIEVIKYILAGADVVMTASSLYKNGIPYLRTMNKELQDWMYMMGFETLDSFKGSMSQQHISDPTAYERANYIKILEGVK
ncbi:MAG: dihydroorotate dehydrogenase-like protein [Chitinophagaceae bacterium]|mgnify:CR=1 FL=1|nr:dihydroorotate dehydrogenase-like protein [Chitinophagaceae bacterium]MBK8300882.1 dihydroorotate dehydrogenase-like protein [Chitinophagaceae bacterium]MBK9660431.1 dihydroorotate dehydrogenase-like protein [Chitinophagaceae bacterium]MBK9938237.1 dihydroorotate dehydrogenase-like protein [Chitinophagaceae bacterium]MBP6231958.1 dihydroorotate dehydrogenase-like protein [Chitinophagaceae bacterium]